MIDSVSSIISQSSTSLDDGWVAVKYGKRPNKSKVNNSSTTPNKMIVFSNYNLRSVPRDSESQTQINSIQENFN